MHPIYPTPKAQKQRPDDSVDETTKQPEFRVPKPPNFSPCQRDPAGNRENTMLNTSVVSRLNDKSCRPLQHGRPLWINRVSCGQLQRAEIKGPPTGRPQVVRKVVD